MLTSSRPLMPAECMRCRWIAESPADLVSPLDRPQDEYVREVAGQL